jgi:hypothetical protein
MMHGGRISTKDGLTIMDTNIKSPQTPNNAITQTAVLPGPGRRRMASIYRYRVTYTNPHPSEPGCVMLWEVTGGRFGYQIALELTETAKLHWHCTCADAVFRGENQPHLCKHIRGLQALRDPEDAAA